MPAAICQVSCAALVLAGTWLTLCASPARAAGYGSDPIPFAPYGMDPVPPARFYRGAWDLYGSDPTPRSYTSDLGFRDVYGLDSIPEAILPSVHELHDVLPHQALQVLTGAIEGGVSQESAAPPRCRP